LVGAFDHAWNQLKVTGEQTTRPNVVLAVAGLDVPVIVVDGITREMEMRPWARVVSAEAHASGKGKVSHFIVDVIHASFVQQFLTKWVLPFAAAFGERCHALASVLQTMNG